MKNETIINQNRKSLVYGIGINDATYPVYTTMNGKKIVCPYYSKWLNMLKRCYSYGYHKSHPSYIDCSVCDKWLSFMNFRLWMSSKDWVGKELDKDILVYGNKVYSPNTCLFVTREINLLISVRKIKNNKCPQGVHWFKQHNKYLSSIRKRNKLKYLGLFNTIEEAELVYLREKVEYITEIAYEQENENLLFALLRYVNRLNKEIENNKIKQENKK